ncbi:hypothetical protein Dred_0811 [Desulforamulus reducens MI-1]|uniref:Putative Flp pilus-assembly TadG-like N-terminal domain-containing protein n=1 Tax=Desulforamulus reducens (strain ATCC BAA-1160 / DSM 100696 / MI-1) TaxID=349161 RepID=A4J2P6_DESRM|nr:Tad domain-containing protein [Desulforamulus reducens]ABO49349.1 hypothetical protein Dred_0811 [Desulforamulus reducens MI-1]
MKNKVLKGKKGFTFILFVPVFLIIMLFMARGIDWGMATVARGKLQTISDAGSLAGASAVEPITKVELVNNDDGSLELREKVTGIKINSEEAQRRARLARELNGGTQDYWQGVGGHWEGTEERIEGDDIYCVKSTARVKLPFLSRIYEKVSGHKDLTITMPGDARSVLIKQKMNIDGEGDGISE